MVKHFMIRLTAIRTYQEITIMLQQCIFSQILERRARLQRLDAILMSKRLHYVGEHWILSDVLSQILDFKWQMTASNFFVLDRSLVTGVKYSSYNLRWATFIEKTFTEDDVYGDTRIKKYALTVIQLHSYFSINVPILLFANIVYKCKLFFF